MIRKKLTIDYPDILKAARDIQPWLTEVRRDLHAHPETAMEETRTRDRICTCLDEMDIPWQILAKTGVIGHIQPPNPEKTIALRADIDELPMTDKKTVPYKSIYSKLLQQLIIKRTKPNTMPMILDIVGESIPFELV